MPYISAQRRLIFNANPREPIQDAGELNYLVTELIKRYVGDHPNYQRYNDVLGALEGAKLELYRRKVAPYEDVKIGLNGDVYETHWKTT
jgi:hypothetical protein